MTTIIEFQGEEFAIHSEILILASQLIEKKALTPNRLEHIRYKIEDEWVNINSYYGGGGYFSDAMFQYYITTAFELNFKASIN